jgi:LmbE family N-acetylglucosaminyl deacetylase
MMQEGEIVPYHTVPLPVSAGPWLVFAPHADDETFGMGGTLALAAQAGLQTHLVVVTDGALGGEGEGLVATRQQEARAAASVLGIQSVDFMHRPDRGLQIDETTVQSTKALIAQLQPRAVFFPGPMELHPDHRRCALLVWQALQELADPAITPVSYEIAVQSPINTLVDISTTMPVKQQAMHAYLSQLGEQRYEKVVMAMNTLRTLTLGSSAEFAEGFWIYDQQSLQDSLGSLLQQLNRRLLA